MPDESGLIRFVKIAELGCPECAMVLQRVSIVQKGMTKMMYLHRGSVDIGCQYVGKYFLIPVEKVDGEETQEQGPVCRVGFGRKLC